MIGQVDECGRALLELKIYPGDSSEIQSIEAWIDTGFTGELVLPSLLISALDLTVSGTVDAILADGTSVQLKTYTCELEWLGHRKQLEVISNQGDFPLLGIGLLLGHQLIINYGQLTVEVID